MTSRPSINPINVESWHSKLSRKSSKFQTFFDGGAIFITHTVCSGDTDIQ